MYTHQREFRVIKHYPQSHQFSIKYEMCDQNAMGSDKYSKEKNH